MARPEDPGVFDFANYAPRHQLQIILVRRQAQRLKRCTICQRFPVVERRALVHIALRSVGAADLDASDLVKPLALCVQHCGLSNDELADAVWGTGWRTDSDSDTATDSDTDDRDGHRHRDGLGHRDRDGHRGPGYGPQPSRGVGTVPLRTATGVPGPCLHALHGG
jgi:hypothetical protein